MAVIMLIELSFIKLEIKKSHMSYDSRRYEKDIIIDKNVKFIHLERQAKETRIRRYEERKNYTRNIMGDDKV